MKDNKRFMITDWCSVPHKFIRHEDGSLAIERLEEMKESGINLIPAYDYGYKTNCEMLAACHKLGLGVLLLDDRIEKATSNNITTEERRELLTAVVNDYSDYPAFQGYYVTDEPGSKAFPVLAEIREILTELDPFHEAYYNLFPNYATLEMLGNSSYYEHVEQFLADVKPEILSYDHYHFIKSNSPEAIELADKREKQIYDAAFSVVERPGFFDNIEDVRTACKKANTPLMVVILLVEHGPYRNLTEAEIRWEVFQSLAYGSKRISYFTYWCPGVDKYEGDDFWHWNNAMITKEGERTPHYYMVKNINAELQIVGDILLDKENNAVFHFGRIPDTKVTYWQGSYGDVSSLDAANMTASFFDGNLLLLANKDYDNPMPVTLTLTEGKSLKKLNKQSGIWEMLSANDGCYSLVLAEGDGELLKIV